MPECKSCHKKSFQMIWPILTTLIITIFVFVGGVTGVYKTDIRIAILLMVIMFNLLTFFLFGLDKCCARNEGSRVAEVVLFYMTFFGSPIGAGLGMVIFNHKRSKKEFLCVIIPLCLVNMIWLFLYFMLTAKKSLSGAFN